MIYFAQIDGGPIKIGCSENVDARLRQLETLYRRPVALLGTMPGDDDRETEIHERFRHLRFGRKEQFRPAEDLMAFIGKPLLVSPNPDAVEEAAHGDRDDVSIKFDRTLARKARQVSLDKGTPMAEYLSEMARSTIERDYATLLRKIERGNGGGSDSN